MNAIGPRVIKQPIAIAGALLLIVCCCPISWALAEPELSFDFGGHAYPILYVGETISASREVAIRGEFLPLFGPERAVVNPALPEIRDGRTLVFATPGEYYLEFEDDVALKVRVLSTHEPSSESVLRLFHFCCANMLVSLAGDQQFGADSNGFIKDWFQREEPAMLLCGPTQSAFGMMIRDRFDLPVRMVTFPGCAWSGKTIVKATHNVPEVYLPDHHKWVLFDINNAFMPSGWARSRSARSCALP